MARQKKDIDKQELQDIIDYQERYHEFANISALCKAVAETDWAKDRDISAQVVYSRIKEFGLEIKTEWRKRDRSAKAGDAESDTSETESSEPKESARVTSVDPSLSRRLREVDNYCRDLEKLIEKQGREIERVRHELEDWKRWKSEAIYDRVVKKVTDELRRLLTTENIPLLTQALNELNAQAHVNPLGEQFFDKEGRVKQVAVHEPIGPSTEQ